MPDWSRVGLSLSPLAVSCVHGPVDTPPPAREGFGSTGHREAPGAASAAEGASIRCVNVEFALLGPLEVRCDSGSIPLRRGRPRTLLISLLLRVGRVVPTDVLIDDVWREHPLSDPANALQSQVSYLRRVLRLTSHGVGSGASYQCRGAMCWTSIPLRSMCAGSSGMCRRRANDSVTKRAATPRPP